MDTEARILEIARTIRADAWVDLASGGAYSLGFVDNRLGAAKEYNEAATQAAAALRAAGFRVKMNPGSAHWPFAIVKIRA